MSVFRKPRILLLVFLMTVILISCGKDDEVTGPSDTLPPTVEITSPNNGALANGIMSVTVQAEDDSEISYIDLFINDIKIHSDSSSSLTYQWNTNDCDDFSIYSFRATASDISGNIGESNTVNVTVNNKKVDINIFTPSNGSHHFEWSPIEFQATAIDNQGNTITDEYLIWTCNNDTIGTGHYLNYDCFGIGTYTVNVSVNNDTIGFGQDSCIVVMDDDPDLTQLTYSSENYIWQKILDLDDYYIYGYVSGSEPGLYKLSIQSANLTFVASGGFWGAKLSPDSYKLVYYDNYYTIKEFHLYTSVTYLLTDYTFCHTCPK